jgi:diadenosine tetraphosphate (Ap4A) HIT family hydrolase
MENEGMKKVDNCPFCYLNSTEAVIYENKQSFAIYDRFPVTNGHVLIIPKKHVISYFDLSIKEQNYLWEAINKVKSIIADRFNPDGYNIGININEVAGQTVLHTHIHLIPRYKGDVKNPRGGIRNIIPEKGDYLVN